MVNEFLPLLYSFHFYLFGLIAIAASIAFVTRKSPVSAALWLVVVMFCLAALYVMMDAQFVGVMQVLVYAGAIMVVFVFVVMLLNLGEPAALSDVRSKWGRILAGFLGLALVAELMALTRTPIDPRLIVPPVPVTVTSTGGIIGGVAGPLFREYLLAFELTSVLLLVAIAGAVVLGRKRSAN
ncbi:MAG TPA: NADH-quinone oxidoreductase subunit J [Gemmatimonadaceae bacterium]|jgi:NADH-quinone oxidoreductase subunit J